MLELGLYLIFIFSIFYRFIFDVSVIIQGSGIWTTDILIFIILLFFLLKYGHHIFKKKFLWCTILRKITILTFILLIIPGIIGIIKGHYLVTILRDCRSIILVLIPFVFLKEIKTLKTWSNYLKFILIITFINLLIFYFMFIFDLSFPMKLGLESAYETSSILITRHGIVTSLYYYSVCLFIVFNFWLFKIYPQHSRKIFILFILLFFAVFQYSMRALSYGVLMALLVNLLLFPKKKTMNFALILILILIPLILIAIPTKKIIKYPYIERHLSMLFPELGTEAQAANREVRFEAIRLATKNLDHFYIGTGYGEYKGFYYTDRDPKMRFWNHSSIGWAIYKLGFIGFVSFTILFTSFIINAIKIVMKFSEKYLKVASFGLIMYLISLFILAGGSNVLFRGDFSTILISIILGLLISAENINMNHRNRKY